MRIIKRKVSDLSHWSSSREQDARWWPVCLSSCGGAGEKDTAAMLQFEAAFRWFPLLGLVRSAAPRLGMSLSPTFRRVRNRRTTPAWRRRGRTETRQQEYLHLTFRHNLFYSDITRILLFHISSYIILCVFFSLCIFSLSIFHCKCCLPMCYCIFCLSFPLFRCQCFLISFLFKMPKR